MPTSSRITWSLGLAGLVPFVVPALLLPADPGAHAPLATLADTYAFAIVCFLTGSWWGSALVQGGRAPLVISNLLLLIAFFVYLFAREWWSLAAAFLLVTILLCEQIPDWFPPLAAGYSRLRVLLTAVATVSMLVVHVAR